jgi:hypothetical protein
LMACALLLGLAICRLSRWRFDSWRERLVITAALGIGGWAFLGLGLAAAGMYRVGVLRALVAMTLLSGIGWWMMQRRPLPDLRSSRVGEYSRSAWLWIGTTILAVSCAFIAALAPEREYDALWYHLAYPQRYLQVGQLVDISSDYVSLYPMTWELWFGYGLAALTFRLSHPRRAPDLRGNSPVCVACFPMACRRAARHGADGDVGSIDGLH